MSSLISSFLISLTCFYLVRQKERKFFSRKSLLYIFIYTLFIFYSYKYMNVFRLLCSFIVFYSLTYLLIGNYLKTFLSTIYTFFIFFVSEIIIMILLYTLNLDSILNLYGHFYVNVLTVFFSLVLDFLIAKHLLIIRSIKSFFDLRTVIMIFVFLLLFFELVYLIYFDASRLLIISTVACSVFSLFLFLAFNLSDRSNLKGIESVYSESINRLIEYENLITKMSFINHENDNNLIILRDLIDGERGKEYIDSLIAERLIHKDENVMLERLPLGGMRGLIIQKKTKAESLGIEFNLFVETVILPDIELCKLLAIYLDNAIDAAATSSLKLINLGFYRDIITVSNSFSEIKKTKKINRGFGLLIAKKIISRNKFFVDVEISEFYKVKIKRIIS